MTVRAAIKLRSLAFLGLLLITMVGCQRAVSPRQVARMNLYTDPGTLDPRQVDEIVGRNVSLALYEGLTRIGADNRPELALATAICLSDDGRRATITLRESQWSNGELLTAHDFVNTWQSALAPDFPSSYSYQLYVLKSAALIKAGKCPKDSLGAVAVDDHTLVLDFEHPVPYLWSLLATPPFFPYHPSGCGNGPFCVTTWQADQRLDLHKNPLFWDADSVHLDGLEFVIIKSELTSLLMFEQGELDYIGLPFFLIPLEAISDLQRQHILHTHDVAAVYWYKLNTSHPVLSNQKVRQALSRALSRTALVNFVTHGIYAPSQGALPDCLRSDFPSQIAAEGSWTARDLFHQGLRELGMTLEDVGPLELSFNNCADHLKFAASVQQQWEQTLGIQIQLVVREWRDHLAHIADGDFTIARHAWQAHISDPVDVLQPFATRGPLNATHWYNETYANYLQAAQEALDPQKRSQLISQAEALLVAEAPIIPIFSYRYPYCLNPNLEGIVLSQLATVDYRWASFISP